MSKRISINTTTAPRAVGPYSQAVTASGDFIFTAGQIPINPANGKLVEGDFKAQVRQVLMNISKLLKSGGSSLDHAVKLTVFLTDISRFGELNDVFGEFFTDNPPARSAVEVSRLPLGAMIEIECIAVRE